MNHRDTRTQRVHQLTRVHSVGKHLRIGMRRTTRTLFSLED